VLHVHARLGPRSLPLDKWWHLGLASVDRVKRMFLFSGELVHHDEEHGGLCRVCCPQGPSPHKQPSFCSGWPWGRQHPNTIVESLGSLSQTSKYYRLLKFCYVPATSITHYRLLFFLLRPFVTNEANKAGGMCC
jgi:hypothetical protein